MNMFKDKFDNRYWSDIEGREPKWTERIRKNGPCMECPDVERGWFARRHFKCFRIDGPSIEWGRGLRKKYK